MAKLYDITFSQTGLTGLGTTIAESYSVDGKIGSSKELMDNAGAVADTYMTEPAVETTVANVRFTAPITAPVTLVDTAVTLMGTAGTCDSIEISGSVDEWWDSTVKVDKDLTLT